MRPSQLNPVARKRLKVLLEKAKEAQHQERWAEAYEAYTMVLQQDRRNFGILVQMGHMSKEIGDFDRAEAHYREALELKPDDWDLQVQFGHLYNRWGDPERAKTWYAKANALQPTAQINELLHTIADGQKAEQTRELRKTTLDQMDSRSFIKALPNALALYEIHGLRDFDVILGHVYRELGRYDEAKTMYEAYFERCIRSNSRYLNDAFWHLMNILEILEERQAILKLFSRLKRHMFEVGKYSELDRKHSELLTSHVGKMYGVLDC
jgi:tetratricopeptide (TPR) repeat protein